MNDRRFPLGIKLMAAFFAIGAVICLLTTVMLVFPAALPVGGAMIVYLLRAKRG